MTKQDCGSEILELQKQLDEMRAQQKVALQEESKSVSEETSADDVNDAEGDEIPLLRDKMDELMELLQLDMKQVPVGAAVGFFALGVLMGRLISK